MVESAFHLRGQHQYRALVWDSGSIGRASHSFSSNCLWEESCECASIIGVHGGWIFHCRLCIRVFAKYSTTVVVCCFLTSCCNCVYQFWFDHRTHIYYESRSTSLAECNGVPCVCSVRISFSHRAPARLDDSRFVVAASILGSDRAPWHVHGWRVAKSNLDRLGHDAAL